MNREIKFRVWDREKNKFGEVAAILLMKENKIYFQPSDISYNRFIFQQYTGLKDKNRKEVYEGDIVLMGNRSINKYAKVEYSDEQIGFLIEDRFIREFLQFNKIAIVGNIFENPELLK